MADDRWREESWRRRDEGSDRYRGASDFNRRRYGRGFGEGGYGYGGAYGGAGLGYGGAGFGYGWRDWEGPYGRGYGREGYSGRRDWMDRAGDEVSSWFGDDGYCNAKRSIASKHRLWSAVPPVV